MAKIDGEKRERDKQIHPFIQKTLKELLRLARRKRKSKLKKVDLNQLIGDITPEQQRYADEVMRIFREEDR